MPKDIKDLVKFFKKPKVWKKQEFEINPNLYWRYLLVFHLLVVSSSFVFGILIYRQVAKVSVYQAGSRQEEERFDQKNRILEMLEYFEKRRISSEEIIEKPSLVVDPSL